ncbi:MAG: phosphoserine transaminase, partial [Acidimicrobiales bacterium]
LFLLAHQMEWILSNGGLKFSVDRCDRSAEILYGWAERVHFATPFVSKPSQRSHVVGTLDFDESINAEHVTKNLRQNGILDTEPYRKLGRNQIRVGMYPAIDPEDVESLCACVDFVVGETT